MIEWQNDVRKAVSVGLVLVLHLELSVIVVSGAPSKDVFEFRGRDFTQR